MGQALFCALGGRCGCRTGFTQGPGARVGRCGLCLLPSPSPLLSAELLGSAKRLNVNYQDADG